MFQVSLVSFPSPDEFWETVEVRDPLPSVPAELGKPTHDLTWRNLAILNARRKRHAYKFPWATWLALFPTENPPVEGVPDDLPTADENQCVQLEEEGERFPSAKLFNETWLLDGPFESLTEVVVVEKTITIIGNTRTESDRSHTSYVYGLISEDRGEENGEEENGEEENEEEDESESDASIPTAFIAETDSSGRTLYCCIIPETTQKRPWGNICRGCDGGR